MRDLVEVAINSLISSKVGPQHLGAAMPTILTCSTAGAIGAGASTTGVGAGAGVTALAEEAKRAKNKLCHRDRSNDPEGKKEYLEGKREEAEEEEKSEEEKKREEVEEVEEVEEEGKEKREEESDEYIYKVG